VLGLVAVLIVVALAGALLVLPLRAWMNQREDLAERRSELAALQEATARLEADIARLQTPEGIEDAAREELGYVELGERRLAVVDVPKGSVDLPPGWPYSLVQQILAVRAMPPVEPTPTEAG
jgi:cell division protein FtsB